MTNDETISLGARLSPVLGGGFFPTLGRSDAPMSMDSGDRNAEASADGGQVKLSQPSAANPESGDEKEPAL